MKKFLLAIGLIISIVFLFIFTLPILSNILNLGNLFGIFLCLYLIFYLGFNNTYKKIKRKLCKIKLIKLLWRIYNVVAILFTIYAITISCAMIITSCIAPQEGATVVVLGAKVNNNGASVILYQRMDAAKNYLIEHPDSDAVVSGGKGIDEPISEALCMYQYLSENDINYQRIYIEDKSTNTYENIKFSNEIISSYKLTKSLAITTDSYHQFRARLIARKQGITADIGAVNSNTTSSRIATLCYPTYFVREWFAIPAEFLK